MRTEVFIDFDGTITDSVVGTEGPPQSHCVETINSLYDSGKYEIVIYSCRSNPEFSGSITKKRAGNGATALELKWAKETIQEEMMTYLHDHGIKFHRVEPNKPHYHIIIDDRAMNPKQGWLEIGKEINESFGSN